MAESRQAFEAGDAQRAIYAAREALAFDGRNAEAWAIRARSSLSLDRYQDAEFEAKEAVRLEPHIATAHDVLAEVFKHQQRYGEALREAHEAVRLDPRDPDNRLTLASIHVARKELPQAVALFEQLTQDFPGEPYYRALLASALNSQAVSTWTELPNGDRLITTDAQVRLTREVARRAGGLEFDNEDVRQELRESVAAANLAETKRWMHARPIQLRLYVGTVIALGLFGLVCFGAGTAGTVGVGFFIFLIVAAIIAVYVVRHRKFVWEHDAVTARQLNRRR